MALSSWLLVAVYFVFTSYLTSAQNGQNGVYFIFPIEGLTLNYLDTVNVSYTSNFSKPQLFTFCKNKTTDSIITEQVDKVTPYNGSQLVTLNFLGGTPCWFNLRPNASAGFGANSPSFPLLPVQRSQTTLGVDSQILPTDRPSSTPSATAPAVTTTVTSVVIPTGTPSPSLSSGAKAGIGVGCASILSLLGALGGFLWWRRKRTRMAVATPLKSSETQKSDEPSIASSRYQRHELYQPPPELSVVVKHELPTTETRELGER